MKGESSAVSFVFSSVADLLCKAVIFTSFEIFIKASSSAIFTYLLQARFMPEGYSFFGNGFDGGVNIGYTCLVAGLIIFSICFTFKPLLVLCSETSNNTSGEDSLWTYSRMLLTIFCWSAISLCAFIVSYLFLQAFVYLRSFYSLDIKNHILYLSAFVCFFLTSGFFKILYSLYISKKKKTHLHSSWSFKMLFAFLLSNFINLALNLVFWGGVAWLLDSYSNFGKKYIWSSKLDVSGGVLQFAPGFKGVDLNIDFASPIVIAVTFALVFIYMYFRTYIYRLVGRIGQNYICESH